MKPDSAVITFLQNGEKHELDLLGKPDDLLRFENTIEDDRITIRLTPKSAIEITELKVVYPYEFDERDHILMNGYQSWTVCKEYSSDTTIDRAENMAKVLKHRKTDNTGDRQFTDYEKENRWLHGVSYGYIRQKADFRFFGSLNEQQGFTFFDIDTKKETFTIRKDLQTRLFDTEFTALDVIDPRGYDQMSIKDYIALNPPDLVIMLCYATSMEQEDFQNFGQDVECTAAEKALWEAPSVSLRGTASDGRDYLSVPLSLEPGKGYRLEMDSVDVLSGLPEGISAVLLRGGEKLDETAFDVDYGNLYGYRWGFYVPDNPSGESACELRLYAGIAENTGGIGLLCSGLRIRECVLSADQSGAAAASSPAEESSRASITASTGMTHSE